MARKIGKEIQIDYPCGCKIHFAKMESDTEMMLAFNEEGQLDVPYQLKQFQLCNAHKKMVS